MLNFSIGVLFVLFVLFAIGFTVDDAMQHAHQVNWYLFAGWFISAMLLLDSLLVRRINDNLNKEVRKLKERLAARVLNPPTDVGWQKSEDTQS